MSKSQIEIEATIKADANKVWEYWNRPEHVTQWNFASPDWQCPSAESDLRPGGKFKSRMEAKDGSFGFDFEGTYDDVVAQKKVSYTMPDGRKVVTTFEKTGDGTRIKTLFDPETENPIEMQKDGWAAILNNFKNYAESH